MNKWYSNSKNILYFVRRNVENTLLSFMLKVLKKSFSYLIYETLFKSQKSNN